MARRAVRAIRHLSRAVPRPRGLGALFHGAMPWTHGRLHGRPRVVRWWLCYGVLPQERRQPGQEPRFIRVA